MMDKPDHLHIYNMRGYCWCGTHRDDWLHNEDMLERIGEAFKKLADDAPSRVEKAEDKQP